MKQLMLMMLCAVGCWRDDVPRRQIVAGAPVAPSARVLDGDTIAGREHCRAATRRATPMAR
jgi:hypothetical protein